MRAGTGYHHLPLRVLVAGGGVAALETCLALRALAGDRVHVTLLAPNRYLVHRPVGVCDPLAVHGRVRVPLARLAHEAGADLRHDRVTSIEPAARRVHTAAGYELPYDVLVVAIGARPGPPPAGAEVLHEDNTAGCRVLMHRLYEGHVPSLAFIEPPAPTDVLDLYELAVHAAVTLRQRHVVADLTFATAEPAPLAVLGPRASGVLRATLAGHGLRIVESAYVRSIGGGEVQLAPPARRILAEHVVAAPRLVGPRPDHLPCDRDGFLRVDPTGRVPGVPGVFAAGNCTAFPVKHPSLAAQQAHAVAASIAADTGQPLPEDPFKPVLRCMLPTRLRWYVEAPLTGGQGDATRISTSPLWSPQLRFDAPFLAPFLEHEERHDALELSEPAPSAA